MLYFVPKCLCEHAGATGLNGVNLSLGPGETTEASRELRAVEELAGLGLDGTQRGASVAADGAVEGGATERAVLLGLGAVGSKRVRESAGWRGGVNARSVVNGLWDLRLAHGFKGSEIEHVLGTERLPTKRIRGVRAALERTEVTRIMVVSGRLL